MVAAFEQSGSDNPAIALEYKELIDILSSLEPVHQEIIFCIYYKGQSMRNLAEEWKIDDLSVIREHKVILEFLCERLENPGSRKSQLKIRRGLRTIAQTMRRKANAGPFTRFTLAAMILLCSMFWLERHIGITHSKDPEQHYATWLSSTTSLNLHGSTYGEKVW